ncbi:hypothetical protein SLEP1_g17262 [Rubroshorea leprosula]|uniref:Uncharacterized protein n=1 Tax=Rubroshorea leprosula TaxID=152421 RepID=A0AAV5J453_9ROSI|nr:hypothetical protein SLEP1_g17262 [Rubroshorea leprosula]
MGVSFYFSSHLFFYLLLVGLLTTIKEDGYGSKTAERGTVMGGNLDGWLLGGLLIEGAIKDGGLSVAGVIQGGGVLFVPNHIVQGTGGQWLRCGPNHATFGQPPGLLAERRIFEEGSVERRDGLGLMMELLGVIRGRIHGFSLVAPMEDIIGPSPG